MTTAHSNIDTISNNTSDSPTTSTEPGPTITEPARVRIALRQRLRLDKIPPALHDQACRALEAGDVRRFVFSTCDSSRELALVFENASVLLDLGLYEQALLTAFTGTRTNYSHYRTEVLAQLFDLCDRDRLRAAGDPLPGPGPFTLYRGVAGSGRRRRLRGLSWTDNFERARWFAMRFSRSLAHPAVLQVTVDEAAVLAFLNTEEREFIVALPGSVRPARVWTSANTTSATRGAAVHGAVTAAVIVPGGRRER